MIIFTLILLAIIVTVGFGVLGSFIMFWFHDREVANDILKDMIVWPLFILCGAVGVIGSNAIYHILKLL